jgi:hypothetical protein
VRNVLILKRFFGGFANCGQQGDAREFFCIIVSQSFSHEVYKTHTDCLHAE